MAKIILDAQARQRPNAHRLFAVGAQYGSDRTPDTMGREAPRWFVMAESRRHAVQEVLRVHGAEIATRSCGAVKDGGRFGLPLSEGHGSRILWACMAEDVGEVMAKPGKLAGACQAFASVVLPGQTEPTDLWFWWDWA